MHLLYKILAPALFLLISLFAVDKVSSHEETMVVHRGHGGHRGHGHHGHHGHGHHHHHHHGHHHRNHHHHWHGGHGANHRWNAHGYWNGNQYFGGYPGYYYDPNYYYNAGVPTYEYVVPGSTQYLHTTPSSTELKGNIHPETHVK